MIAGDLFPIPANLSFFSNGDIESLFGKKICDIFSNADLSICNLEGTLTDNDERCSKIGPVLVSPTKVISSYKKLGIDCCMLANNHITDGGHQGVLDTLRVLEKEEIGYLGAGPNENEIRRSCIYELGGTKIGLYNVCERMFNKPTPSSGGAWLYDEYIVCREIAELKSRCDYLIVVYHGGIEQFRFPSRENRKRFHRMADNGADMILSQHTHCVGCEEWYNDAYLLYGQGNFLFRNLRPGQTDEAVLIEVIITDGTPKVVRHKVRCEKNMFVRYDEYQDFSDFEERSKLLNDEKYVDQQFAQFCLKRLELYLSACKSPSRLMRVIMKFLPSVYKKWLFDSYNPRNLLFMLYILWSEQKGEEAMAGLERLLYEKTRKK